MIINTIAVIKKLRAFTLVEVLISFFILTIVLLGLMSVMIIITGGIVTTRDRERATLMALSEMERMEGIPFDDLNLFITPKIVSEDSFVRTVQTFISTDSADIVVSVAWSGGDSKNKSVKFSREVSRFAYKNKED